MDAARPMAPPEPAHPLVVDDVHAAYQQGIAILQGISLQARAGALTTIIGPNGAGKSTFLKTVFGFLTAHRGSIRFRGQDITRLRPHQIKRLGMSYVPQGINIFPQLTVEENLLMGAWVFRHDRARCRRQVEHVYQLFPVLYQRRRSRATELSGGQAKMLSIAKEIMTDPDLILVDEPSAGLAPQVAQQAYDLLLEARQALGATIVLVDQNIEQAVEIADYVYLFNLGRVKAHGPRAEFGIDRVRELLKECLLGE